MQRVQVITGKNNSGFPYCTSLLIDGGDLLAVVDPGAGAEALKTAIGERHVDLVINTHYHFDHINGNYLFPGSRVLLNPVEAECFPDLTKVGRRLGIQEYYGESGVTDWIDSVQHPDLEQNPFSPGRRHEWWLSTRTPAEGYSYDQIWSIGQVKLAIVHAPGHTQGFCCPFFPDEGAVYTGDIDLTSFGPWYAGTDGDIDSFIHSARRIALLDADRFITGHQAGVLSRSEFRAGLERFLNVIEVRQRRLVKLLESGVKPGDVPKHGLLYPPKYHVDPWIQMWESIAVRKHLDRLKGNPKGSGGCQALPAYYRYGRLFLRRWRFCGGAKAAFIRPGSRVSSGSFQNAEERREDH